jgi:hypothetical protein
MRSCDWHPVVVLAIAAACLSSCGRQVQTALSCPSPDDRVVAHFHVVSGGGAAGWAWESVTIQPAGEVPDPDRFVFKMLSGYHVVLNWTAPDALRIEYPDQGRAVTQLEAYDVPQGLLGRTVRSVKIAYRPVETVKIGQLKGGARCGSQPDR